MAGSTPDADTPQVVTAHENTNIKGGSAATVQFNLEQFGSPSEASTAAGSTMRHIPVADIERVSLPVAQLQPADEGFGAWSYAASAFAMFITVWGFPEAFPAFQAHLSELDEYQGSVVLALLAPGLNDVIEGILFQLLPKAPWYRRRIVLSAIALMTISLVLASAATTAWQIVLTQGVLFGIGGVMLNFVHVSIFPEWFIKKKASAMSIIWLGWRIGSLGFPLISRWLLESQGYETTLQVLTVPIITLLLPSAVAFRGRFPEGHAQSTPVRPPYSQLRALRRPAILFYLFATIIFSMVINAPTLFIMRFGADIGLDATQQAMAYCLRVLSSMAGIYIFGKYSDHGLHRILMLWSALSSSLVHFLFWGLAKEKIGIYSYAIAIGLASGGFDNSLYGLFAEISEDNPELFTAVHGVFSLFRGLAVLSIGPVGMAILRQSPDIDISCYAICKYKYLVWYVGSFSMASGALMGIKFLLR